jgi:hypothetical protein
MTKAPNRRTSLLQLRGVARPARVRVFAGSGAPGVACRWTPLLLAAALAALALSATVALAAQAPTIVESSVKSSGETRETASVQAEVNPGGEPASYVFEYGPSISYGLSVSGSIPTGSVEVPVEQELTGLEANQEYHWRLVVKNNTGAVTSVDHTFVYSTGIGGLPDGREYELVTPAHKNGAAVGEVFGSPPAARVSEDGKHLLTLSIQCFAGAESCEPQGGSKTGQPYEFARTASGWAARPLALPNGFSGIDFFFGQSTGATAFYLVDSSLESLHPGWNFYIHNPVTGGAFGDIGPVQPPGTTGEYQDVKAIHATASGNHLVYEFFTEPDNGVVRWPFDPSLPTARLLLYEYEGLGGAEPRLVALAPNSSTELASRCGNDLGRGNFKDSGAQSEDGETVYFTAYPCEASENANQGQVKAFTLYARYEHARTQLVSGPAPSSEPPVGGEACDAPCRSQSPGNATFEGASSDGSRVFFIDPHQLTDRASEDTNSEEAEDDGYCQEVPSGFTGCNLYESECPDRCVVPSERKLVAVSAGDTSGEGPRVQGVMAISKDGSHIYFVAKGVLSATANGSGQLPANGKPNLYVYEHDNAFPTGHLAFIATLSAFAPRTANMTPDGRFLVFRSVLALTADDTRPDGPSQVYRYDALTGVLSRVSIGARGFADDGNEGSQGATIVRVSAVQVAEPERFDPTMSDDGNFVFFQSPDGLTPRAFDDVPAGSDGGLAVNVYEWEAPGTTVGGKVQCAEAAGCVSLVSDGKDLGEYNELTNSSSVELLGSDASGANVFFATSDALVEQDTNTERDIYDAHVCSAEEPCPAPVGATPPCLGEVCHGIPAATPSLFSPGSASFNGAGNLTPPTVAAKKVTKKAAKCKKGFLKNRSGKCVRRTRKKSRAKKTNHSKGSK